MPRGRTGARLLMARQEVAEEFAAVDGSRLGPDPERPYLLLPAPPRVHPNGHKFDGRRPQYGPEDVEAILSDHAAGKTIREACSPEDRPQETTFMKWVSGAKTAPVAHAQLVHAYAHAGRSFVYSLISGATDVAAGRGDQVLGLKNDNATVNQRKLYINWVQWLAEKMIPERFGQRLAVSSGASQLMQYIQGRIDAGAGRDELAVLHKAAGQIKAGDEPAAQKTIAWWRAQQEAKRALSETPT